MAVKRAFLCIVSTINLSGKLSEEIYGYAIHKIGEEHPEFIEDFNIVMDKDLPVMTNEVYMQGGISKEKLKSVSDDYILSWLEKHGIKNAGLESIFVFQNEATNSQNGETFTVRVYAYIDK